MKTSTVDGTETFSLRTGIGVVMISGLRLNSRPNWAPPNRTVRTQIGPVVMLSPRRNRQACSTLSRSSELSRRTNSPSASPSEIE
jgi:hypothetical protein